MKTAVFTLNFATRSSVVALLSAATLAAFPCAAQVREVDPSEVVERFHLSSSAAARAVTAAEAAAVRLNVGVSISIIDEAGNLLREVRMDGASSLLIDYARRKAQTSLLFGASTDTLASDPGITRMIGQVPTLMLVPGGVPIRFEGKVIGAIGVSGAAPAADAKIAEAALSALSPKD